jgi:hypothetical protein
MKAASSYNYLREFVLLKIVKVDSSIVDMAGTELAFLNACLGSHRVFADICLSTSAYSKNRPTPDLHELSIRY